MTVTIAARWRVTLGVQSLARVSLPPRPATPICVPDLAVMRRVRAELADERARWETEMYFSTIQRMY